MWLSGKQCTPEGRLSISHDDEDPANGNSTGIDTSTLADPSVVDDLVAEHLKIEKAA